MHIDNYITLFYLVFNNVTEYFYVLFWGLGISFSILLLIKLLTGEKINTNINNENSNEINLVEIGKYQENNEINTTEGKDYRNEEIWICSVCNTSNEIYLIKCKKCGKTIE
jgi:ribosomal protein L40E